MIISFVALRSGFTDMVRASLVEAITKETIFRLMVATLAPIVSLALTMIPLEELLKTLVGVLF